MMFFYLTVFFTAVLVAVIYFYYKLNKGKSNYNIHEGWFVALVFSWAFAVISTVVLIFALANITTPNIQDDKCDIDEVEWEDQAGMITLCTDTDKVYDRWFVAPWLPKVPYTEYDWVKVPDEGQQQPWTHIAWDTGD